MIAYIKRKQYEYIQ